MDSSFKVLLGGWSTELPGGWSELVSVAPLAVPGAAVEKMVLFSGCSALGVGGWVIVVILVCIEAAPTSLSAPVTFTVMSLALER